jgi:hypothetical protein
MFFGYLPHTFINMMLHFTNLSGDEAILSWKTSAARKTLGPLQLYFDFTGHLRTANERLQNMNGAKCNSKQHYMHAWLLWQKSNHQK